MSLIQKVTNIDVLAITAEAFTFLAGYFEIPILAASQNGSVIAPLGFIAQMAAMAGIAHTYFQAKIAGAEITAQPGGQGGQAQ